LQIVKIRWYKFAQLDKQRPVLIPPRNSILEYLGEMTVAPITRTVRDIPSEAILAKADGLLRDCAINCDRLQTASKAKIGPRIPSWPPAKMVDVGRAIRFALEL
jgi:mRNA interferase MazF